MSHRIEKNVLNILRRQVMFGNMLDVAVRLGVPNDIEVRRFHFPALMYNTTLSTEGQDIIVAATDVQVKGTFPQFENCKLQSWNSLPQSSMCIFQFAIFNPPVPPDHRTRQFSIVVHYVASTHLRAFDWRI